MQTTYPVLTDTTADAAEDSLTFGRYLDPLERILLNPLTSTPLTIGVFGAWGSGKSTLLQMLSARLKPRQFLCVDFNPWIYRKEPSMLIPLLHTLHDELDREVGGRKFTESAKKIFDILARLGADAMLKAVTVGAISTEKLDKLEETYLKTSGSLTSDIRKLRSILQREADELAKAGTKIVIFIDDLDRCEPEQIIDVLESTKLFLDLENVVVIIAIDKEVIDRGIQVKYNKFNFASDREYVIGAEYLEKMIQLPLQLYPLLPSQVGALIKKLAPPGVALVENHVEFLQKVLIPNPRKIKRVLNILTLTDSIRKATGELGNLDEMPIVTLVLLQVQYPELYSHATRHRELLFALEDVYAGTRNPADEASFLSFGSKGEALRKLCLKFYDPTGPLPEIFGSGIFNKSKAELPAFMSMLGA